MEEILKEIDSLYSLLHSEQGAKLTNLSRSRIIQRIIELEDRLNFNVSGHSYNGLTYSFPVD